MKKMNIFDKISQIHLFEEKNKELEIKLDIKFNNEEKLKKEKDEFFKKMKKDYLSIKRNLMFVEYQEDFDNKVGSFFEYYITALYI